MRAGPADCLSRGDRSPRRRRAGLSRRRISLARQYDVDDIITPMRAALFARQAIVDDARAAAEFLPRRARRHVFKNTRPA